MAPGPRGPTSHNRAPLEGRIATASVQARMRTDPRYATGVRRAEALCDTPRVDVPALVAGVRASRRGGMLAVAQGQDSGPRFDRRHDRDPAFRHGVSDMRRARENDPGEYRAQSERIGQLARQVSSGVCGRIAG